MGSSYSSVYSEHPNLAIWKKVFDVLLLTEKNIAQLHEEFSYLPLDKQGTINTQKFMYTIGIEINSFTSRVFSSVDTRLGNNINFGEFVVVLWNLCTLGNNELGAFAFDLYDDNCSGEVGASTISEVINDLYGDVDLDCELQELVYRFAHMPGTFNVNSFCECCQKHPAIVTPILAIQEKVRRIIMGEGFWKRLTKSREQSLSVMTLSKLRILLLQYNDNRHRKQPSKSYLRVLSSRFASFASQKIYVETTKVADECPGTPVIEDGGSEPLSTK